MEPAQKSRERDRKAEHIELALDRSMQLGTGWFGTLELEHQALPELDLDTVSCEVDWLGRKLAAPLLISCMTGGTGEATRINRNLARAAEAARVAIGVGSQRKALEDPSQEESFRIRELAPSVPLVANLGAVQLNYGYGVDECRRAVEMIEADALALHLNPLQEALQPEGQCDFSGLVEKIGEVAARLEVPVIVKEIGCGLSRRAAESLLAAGLEWFDTAGVGGTSWARIEAARAAEVDLGERFADWGIPTPRSIREIAALPGARVIGSGGVRSGVDAAKALALGAELVGIAQPFLEAANESADRAREHAETTIRELRIAMFCTGAATPAALREVRLIERARG